MGIKVVAAEQVPTNVAEQYDRFQGFAEAVEVVGGVHSARQMTNGAGDRVAPRFADRAEVDVGGGAVRREGDVPHFSGRAGLQAAQRLVDMPDRPLAVVRHPTLTSPPTPDVPRVQAGLQVLQGARRARHRHRHRIDRVADVVERRVAGAAEHAHRQRLSTGQPADVPQSEGLGEVEQRRELGLPDLTALHGLDPPRVPADEAAEDFARHPAPLPVVTDALPRRKVRVRRIDAPLVQGPAPLPESRVAFQARRGWCRIPSEWGWGRCIMGLGGRDAGIVAGRCGGLSGGGGRRPLGCAVLPDEDGAAGRAGEGAGQRGRGGSSQGAGIMWLSAWLGAG